LSRRTLRRTHAVCAFLPPHILRSIAENTDDPALRERYHAALETSAQFRGARAAASKTAAAALTAPSLHRTIYDAQKKTALPGKLLRAEGAKPVADIAAGEAYDGAGITYDFYSKVYGRNSVDGRGLPTTRTRFGTGSR